MTGEQAYDALLEAEEKARALWNVATEAKMDHKHIELFRNYVATLEQVHDLWDIERARWVQSDV